MKRILIFSSDHTGAGHRSITEALTEQFSAFPDVEVQVVEGFETLGRSALFIASLYGFLTRRAPGLYNAAWMGSNIVLNGFSRAGKNRLNVRLQHKGDHWTLRFRDDCTAFDPIRHVSENGPEDVGIHLVMRMADEARYTYSMDLNNLVLILREKQQ